MGRSGIYFCVTVLFLAVFCTAEMYGQLYPERRHIRSGNRDYESMKYGESEERYREAISKNPISYEAHYNLGDALYKQGRHEESENIFEMLSEYPFMDDVQRSETFYNLGNSQFQQQKYSEALESYKQSLMLNPDDLEAKYNYAYVKKLLEDQQGDGDGEGDNDQDDQDNDSDGDDGQDNRDGGDQNNDDSSDDKEDENDDDRDDRNDGQDQQPPRESSISRDDAEKMLEAVQNQEDKTREKIEADRKSTVGRSGKNW